VCLVDVPRFFFPRRKYSHAFSRSCESASTFVSGSFCRQFRTREEKRVTPNRRSNIPIERWNKREAVCVALLDAEMRFFSRRRWKITRVYAPGGAYYAKTVDARDVAHRGFRAGARRGTDVGGGCG
jgi:hypothetical protein